MCLVLLCATGFFAIEMAPWLSSISIVGSGEVTWRSEISNFRNHTASCVAELSATYSASDVDNATTACFLLSQLIGPTVIKKRLPVVE